MPAYVYFTRGNITDLNTARRMVEDAIAMCPENPAGYYNLGWVYCCDYLYGNTKSPQETIERGIELAQKTLSMDDSIYSTHGLLCLLYVCKREYDKAIAEGELGLALDPDNFTVLHNYARCLISVGRPEEAIPILQRATRLSPFGPYYLYFHLAEALRMTGRFEEAVSAFRKAYQLEPKSIGPHIGLAVTYSMMGREKEARAEAEEILKMNPKFSVDSSAKRFLFKDQSETGKIVNALRKAGLK